MGNMKNNNGTLLVIFINILILFVAFKSCNTHKKAKPCTQCPQYTETIDSMQLRIDTDSVTIDLMEYEYIQLWEENQRFSSMLAEIESQPGGPEMLERLWNK